VGAARIKPADRNVKHRGASSAVLHRKWMRAKYVLSDAFVQRADFPLVSFKTANDGNFPLGPYISRV